MYRAHVASLRNLLQHNTCNINNSKHLLPAEFGARMATALGYLFTDQANAYAQHRPDYPDELYQAITKLGNVTGKELALDVATGSGQVALSLAKTFNRVIGIDDSEGQIKHAIPHPKVEYMQGAAEHMTAIPDASVDLVTVGQALHW